MAQRVLVLTAMVQEMTPLRRALRLQPTGFDPELAWGRCGRAEVVAAVTGMGPEAAERATSSLLDRIRIDHVVMAGVAGGVDPAAPIGSLVVPERVVHHERGTEHRPTATWSGQRRGTLLTTGRLFNEPDHVRELLALGVDAVDMESAAVASVCEERDVPWVAFRAISDRVGDPLTDETVVGLVDADGSADLARAIRVVLGRPGIVPHLVRLGRGTRAATRAAASATVAHIEQLGAG